MESTALPAGSRHSINIYWIGLDQTGLDWNELDRVGLAWVGLG